MIDVTDAQVAACLRSGDGLRGLARLPPRLCSLIITRPPDPSNLTDEFWIPVWHALKPTGTVVLLVDDEWRRQEAIFGVRWPSGVLTKNVPNGPKNTQIALRRYTRRYTKPGDWVADPFTDGSTIRAALAEGRQVVGWEVK